eukprot:1601714-Alexandrium_andersonii.AAC.1
MHVGERQEAVDEGRHRIAHDVVVERIAAFARTGQSAARVLQPKPGARTPAVVPCAEHRHCHS